MFEDKTLVCKECGNEFVFTAGEQEFYAEKGFMNEPAAARAAAMPARRAGTANAKCMKRLAPSAAPPRVPFVPKTDRPIYCSECFAKKRGA